MRLPSLVVTTTIRLSAHRRQHPPRKTVRRNSRCKFPSRSIPRVVGNTAPSSTFSNTETTVTLDRADTLSGFLLSDAPELGHSFLSLPYFLWAHRSGNSSPLRPTRLLLYRFRPQQHWVPSNKADASLRLQAPSLSLVPQRKRGRKKGKNKMLSGIAWAWSLASSLAIKAASPWPLPERRPATP